MSQYATACDGMRRFATVCGYAAVSNGNGSGNGNRDANDDSESDGNIAGSGDRKSGHRGGTGAGAGAEPAGGSRSVLRLPGGKTAGCL